MVRLSLLRFTGRRRTVASSMKFRTIFVHCRYLPFGKYDAFAIYPFLFYKGGYPDRTLINHEHIHFAQQKELLFIGFIVLYLYYWLKFGYEKHPFEQEAIVNQNNTKYLDDRSAFGWVGYLNTG